MSGRRASLTGTVKVPVLPAVMAWLATALETMLALGMQLPPLFWQQDDVDSAYCPVMVPVLRRLTCAALTAFRGAAAAVGALWHVAAAQRRSSRRHRKLQDPFPFLQLGALSMRAAVLLV